MLLLIMNLWLLSLFSTLCLLIVREMYIYTTDGVSGWKDYYTAVRLMITLILTMYWVAALAKDQNVSIGGFLVISAFVIALLNTGVVMMGELCRRFDKKLPYALPLTMIFGTVTIAVYIEWVVLFGSIEVAGPLLYKTFLAAGAVWLGMFAITSSILIAKK